MNLEERINVDLKEAMKRKDQVVKDTLRAVKAAVQLEKINQKKEISDELYVDVIGKQIKMRKDSMEEFQKANRMDLVHSYEKEITILSQYMPKQLSDEELDLLVEDAIVKIQPSSEKDFGKMMKELLPKVKNRCDMKVLNEKIKNRLG